MLSSHYSSLRFCLSLACSLLLTTLAAASTLTWDRTEARVELEPGQEEARATYTVTNTGEAAVRISRIKTSCGCTGSVVDRKIIQPGESSEIVATFHKGKRQGTNHNKLQVYLDDAPEAVATLHMISVIPTLIETQPKIIYWNSSTSKTERTIHVTLDKRYVDEISEIKYDPALLNLTEEADPEGKADRVLRLIPHSFEAPLRDTIHIEAIGKDGLKAETRVHVFVQP